MTAVAELLAQGVSPTGGSVAASLGRKTPQLSRVREELITRGFVTSERGVLRFTIPGMAEYVRDQHEGERALANPEIARYVPAPRPPGDAREAEQLNRVAQPKPPASTHDISRGAAQPQRPVQPPTRRPGRGR